jgi:GTP pyrophosphokinase
MTIEHLLEKTQANHLNTDVAMVRRAYDFALLAHGDQKRKSGEPYIAHPLAVAQLLADEFRLEPEAIAAALLHDVLEDSPNVKPAQIEELFGMEVLKLVNGVTKLSKLDWKPAQTEAEYLRKMLFAMSQDPRVIFIKLADRVHNMRTLDAVSPESQQRNARETMDIYAPLANRAGLYRFKSELEDLAFKYLQPKAYQDIAQRLAESEPEREEFLARVIRILRARLDDAGVDCRMRGREKHIYSIYRKMLAKSRDLDHIYDLRAIRVTINSSDPNSCYLVLGIVHGIWRPIPQEFDDYIANKKENGYQSLHTAVIGPQGKPFEVQIRTREMNHIAEYGIAAHWRYKEGANRRNTMMENRTAWLRQIVEARQEEGATDPQEFMSSVASELAPEGVLAFTPKGDVIELPSGATPIDFAFAVHTAIGERCRGAKVNGRMVPLDYKLQNGDRVQITTVNSGGPSLDWLNDSLGYVVTHRAKQKIRQYFRRSQRPEAVERGRDLLEKEMRKLCARDESFEEIATVAKYETVDDMLAAIGYGDQSAQAVITRFLDAHKVAEVKLIKLPKVDDRSLIMVDGVGGLLTTLARCCKPLPGEPIIGYLTRGRGVTVHREGCRNFSAHYEQERIVKVSWGKPAADTLVPVPICVMAIDRPGLMYDVAGVVAKEGVNITAANVSTDPAEQTAMLSATLLIGHMSQLSAIIGKIEKLPNVLEVYRKR